MDVIERQASLRERLLPIGPLVGALAAGLDLLDGCREIGLGAEGLHAAGAAFVARQAFLQRLLHRALQMRIDGGAHRV
jgi:hypothetical protein